MTKEIQDHFDHCRLERLLPHQIRERLAANPTVYIPLGTIEWHCEHLPVGLDSLTAEGLCLRAAAKTGGIVYPVLYYGTGGGHGNYPWTVIMPGHQEIQTLLNFTLTRLLTFGVKRVVLFSGHFAPAQLELVDRIASEWNAEQWALFAMATSVNRIPGLSIQPDHAGLFETTLLASIAPKLVELGQLKSLSEAPLSDDDIWEDGRHNPTHPLWGVIGADPRHFNPDHSSELLNASVDWLSKFAATI